MPRIAARNYFFRGMNENSGYFMKVSWCGWWGIEEEMSKKVEKNICGFINYVYFRGLVEKR